MIFKKILLCGAMLGLAGVFTSCDKNEDLLQSPQVMNPVNEVEKPQASVLRAVTKEANLHHGLVEKRMEKMSTALEPNTTYTIRFPANREDVLFFYVRNLSSVKLEVEHYRDYQRIGSWTLRTNQRPGETAQEVLRPPRMCYTEKASTVIVRITNPSSRKASIEWGVNFIDGWEQVPK